MFFKMKTLLAILALFSALFVCSTLAKSLKESQDLQICSTDSECSSKICLKAFGAENGICKFHLNEAINLEQDELGLCRKENENCEQDQECCSGLCEQSEEFEVGTCRVKLIDDQIEIKVQNFRSKRAAGRGHGSHHGRSRSSSPRRSSSSSSSRPRSQSSSGRVLASNPPRRAAAIRASQGASGQPTRQQNHQPVQRSQINQPATRTAQQQSRQLPKPEPKFYHVTANGKSTDASQARKKKYDPDAIGPNPNLPAPVKKVDPKGRFATYETQRNPDRGNVVEYSKFNLDKKHLNQGTDTNPSSRKYAQQISNPGPDHQKDVAGHAGAKSLGLPGTKDNVYPQNPNINGGSWKSVEKQIYNDVRDKGPRTLEIQKKYDDKPGQQLSTRPKEVHFKVKDCNGNLCQHGIIDNPRTMKKVEKLDKADTQDQKVLDRIFKE